MSSGKKQVKKILKYIESDRPRKLKTFAKSNRSISFKCIVNKDYENLLHVCAKIGYGTVLRYLIDVGCSCEAKDINGNLPLHVALRRALTESISTARETYNDLICPLIEHYPLALDQEDGSFVTCQDLLSLLKKRLKSRSSEKSNFNSRQNSLKRREEEEWRQKLQEEAEIELEEIMPRRNWEEEEENKGTLEESYNDWSDRIYSEYSAKHKQKIRHFKKTTKENDSRKKEKTHKPENNSKHEDRQRFAGLSGSNTENIPTNPSFIDKKRRYEIKFQNLLKKDNHSVPLTYASIPWPHASIERVGTVLFSDLQDERSIEYKKYLRSQRVRWHPDKFTQRFAEHLHTDHKAKIMCRVKAISQILNKLAEKS